MSRRLLTPAEIAAALPEGWTDQGNALVRTLAFSTYRAGLDFAVLVAAHAEEVDHHPDLLIGYRQVKVHYTTHDRGGVTRRDIEGATFVNRLLEDA